MTTADLQHEKVGPKRAKLLFGGLFGGVAVGMAIAVLRQLRDQRLRYRETLEKALKVPVLAVIGEHKPLRKLRPTKVS
jgi:capsular polysaccharide biosynthesis protein